MRESYKTTVILKEGRITKQRERKRDDHEERLKFEKFCCAPTSVCKNKNLHTYEERKERDGK
jgi:hypothetical protein